VRWAIAIVIVGAVACGGRPTSTSTVTASGKVPPYPTDFEPPPALGKPPPEDPTAVGHAYLVATYDGIHEPWTQFLEECRLRLPPSDPLNRRDLAATIEVELDVHGGILDLRVTGSGNDDFDAAARSVMTDRAPYPPPPADLLSDDGHLHLRWRFARDVRQAGVAGAAVDVIEWSAERAVPKLLAEHHLAEAARRLAREPATAPGRLELAEAVFAAAVAEGVDATDVAARRLAIDVAGRTPVAAAAPGLRARARSAVDPQVRAGTFPALALIGDPETVTLALEAIAERPSADAVTLASAAAALDRLGAADQARPRIAEWLRAFTGGDPAALDAALATLAAIPAGDLLPAVTAAVAKGDARVRAAACATYGRAAAAGQGAAWTALAGGLRDADTSVRAACAIAIGAVTGATPDKKTIGVLAARLADRDLTVKAAAIVALARVAPARAAIELRPLAAATDAVVLAALAEAWSRLAKPPVDRIRKLARSAEAVVRAAAIAALVRLGDPASLDVAALAAGDSAEAVRLAALPAVRAEHVLRELARDTAPAVRTAADERLVALLGRAATVDARLADLAAAEAASTARVRAAASWLLAR
jgi:hypothetical protein